MTRTSGLIAFLVLAACTEDPRLPPRSDPAGADIVRSAKARLAIASATPAEIDAVAGSNLAFAIDLHRQLAAADRENVVFSPYSITSALSMLLPGAEGTTESEMRDALGISIDEAAHHRGMNALDQTLAARERPRVALRIMNGVFVQEGYPILPSYLDTIGEHYGAPVYGVDFGGDPEAARGVINDWISANTGGHIAELFPAGTIEQSSRVVLTNAVYFAADWEDAFDPERTGPGEFTREDGERVTVQLMHKTGGRSASGAGWTAAELEYQERELALLAIVPDDMRAFEETLTAATIGEIVGALFESERLELHVPRISMRRRIDLAQVLRARGMTSAFDPELADLSGMDGTRSLVVDDVLHEATIDIDEAGAVATAATGVEEGWVSLPPTVSLTRPFMLVLRDRATGTVLFIARVMDPTAG